MNDWISTLLQGLIPSSSKHSSEHWTMLCSFFPLSSSSIDSSTWDLALTISSINNYSDCKRDFRPDSMQRGQCPIHNGNIVTFI